MAQIQRYAVAVSGVATSATEQVTIQRTCRLIGIQLALGVDCITDNGIVDCVVSLDGVRGDWSAPANGLIRDLAVLAWRSNFVTSGLAVGGQSIYIPQDEPLALGQPVYAHVVVGAGTVGVDFYALLITRI